MSVAINRPCACVVAAGVVVATASWSRAASVQLTWQASLNGGTYSSSVIAWPGDTVRLRLRVSLTGNTGAGSVGGSGGLAGFNFLPTLTNFGPDDIAVPLNDEQFIEGWAENPFDGVIHHPTLGTVTNVYQGVPATFRGPGNVGGTGRNAPWGANGTNQAGKPIANTANNILTWRAWTVQGAGVSLSQWNGGNSGVWAVTGVDDAGTPGDPSDDTLVTSFLGSFANHSRTNLSVFSYEFECSATPALSEVMVASCSVFSRIGWFTGSGGATSFTENIVVTDAIVHRIVPTPGGVALLGLAGAFAARRRR